MELFHEKLIFHAILAVVLVVAIANFSIIWYYISKKALGMQTMYDIMIKDMIMVSLASFIVATLVNLDIGPINPSLATFLADLQYCSGMVFLVQLLLMVGTRYVIIFHGHLLEELNEKVVVCFGRVSVALVSVVSTTYEIYTNNLGYGPVYEFLATGHTTQANTPPLMLPLTVMTLLDSILMIYVHIRAECVLQKIKRQVNPNNPTESHDHTEGDYSIGTIRVVVGLGVLIVTALGLWLGVSHQARDLTLARLRMHVAFSWVTLNVIPMIFIVRNEKLTDYYVNKIVAWITSSD